VVGVSLVAAALLVSGLVVWKQQDRDRRRDREVCRVLSRLDGETSSPELLREIHDVGRSAHTRLGDAVKAAPESLPGHLFLTSENYDFVVGACARLGVPAPYVDPAAGPRR
jgi:hypothetical protein